MKVLSLKTTLRTMSTIPATQDRIGTNLHSVLSAIKSASSPYQRPVRLVAVSKLFPPEDIQAAYNAGQRHFGENYIQELAGKASALPDDINWHFIGALQSNKCKALAEKVPNLWCVETVDSRKKAHLLEAGRVAGGRKEPLRIFIQVNTSGEDQKAGISPDEVLDLVKFVRGECPHLEFAGLMTIGSADASLSANEEQRNPDFETLISVKAKLLKDIRELGNIELSMGMSDDFEVAIKMGSTNVRVGSKIFGQRPKKETTTKSPG